MVVPCFGMVKPVYLPSPLCCRRRSFLLESLRATSNETIQHGACLGLGLAGLGTCDEELFEDLKGVLYTDSAVRQTLRRIVSISEQFVHAFTSP